MKSLPFFHSIRILTRCEVSLCQDSPFGIHVDEPDEIAIWIDYFIENEELVIQTKPMHYGFLLLNDSYPRFTLHVLASMASMFLTKHMSPRRKNFRWKNWVP